MRTNFLTYLANPLTQGTIGLDQFPPTEAAKVKKRLGRIKSSTALNLKCISKSVLTESRNKVLLIGLFSTVLATGTIIGAAGEHAGCKATRRNHNFMPGFRR